MARRPVLLRPLAPEPPAAPPPRHCRIVACLPAPVRHFRSPLSTLAPLSTTNPLRQKRNLVHDRRMKITKSSRGRRVLVKARQPSGAGGRAGFAGQQAGRAALPEAPKSGEMLDIPCSACYSGSSELSYSRPANPFLLSQSTPAIVLCGTGDNEEWRPPPWGRLPPHNCKCPMPGFPFRARKHPSPTRALPTEQPAKGSPLQL